MTEKLLMKKIAILGAGNMGSAIAESLSGQDCKVAVTAATENTLERVRKSCPDASFGLSNRDAVEDADIVVIAVKPYIAPGVIDEVREVMKPGAIVVSVVAGITLAGLEEAFGQEDKGLSFFRVIPNTAIRYGKSTTFISTEPGTSAESVAEVEGIFSRSGKTFLIAEKDMAACTALSSCGIAFFLRFIRAAVEGSVQLGLRPGFATEVAAYTAEGAAELLKYGSHPEVEIDKVTTPGGITIKGLNEMERHGLTAAVIAALKATVG